MMQGRQNQGIQPGPAQGQFNAKEMMNDALSTQKHLTETYNTWANECVSPTLKNEFMSILEEEHQIQHDLFKDMQQRGWYQVEQADTNKVNQAKQKFQNVL